MQRNCDRLRIDAGVVCDLHACFWYSLWSTLMLKVFKTKAEYSPSLFTANDISRPRTSKRNTGYRGSINNNNSDSCVKYEIIIKKIFFFSLVLTCLTHFSNYNRTSVTKF